MRLYRSLPYVATLLRTQHPSYFIQSTLHTVSSSSILSLHVFLSLSSFSSSLPPIHIDPLFRGCVLILQESLYYSARNSTP